MRAAALLLSAALAACGQTAAPPAAEPANETASTPAPAGDPMSTGLMGGISTSASGDVSAVTIGADALAFSDADGAETFTAPTAYVGAYDASALIKEGGGSFAAAAPSSTATRVEVRRLTGTASERMCSGSPATHVAIVYAEPLTALHLMAFTGADAPGPGARDSDVCAIYAYAVD